MSKVRVLYEFNAEASNEITAYAGEELTVIDPNSYEGWIKIRNSYGQEGIVPSSYVEYIDDDIPPPPSHYPSSSTPSAWDSTPSYVNSYTNQSTSNKESGFDSNFNLNDLLFDKNSKTHSNTLNSNIYEDTSLLDLSVFESKSTASGSVLSSAIQQPTSAAVYSTVQPKMPNTIPLGDLNQLSFTPSYNPPSALNYNSSQPSTYNNTQRSTVTPSRQDSDHDRWSSDDDDDASTQKVQNNYNNNNTSGINNMSKQNVSISSANNATLSASSGGTLLTKHKNKNSYGLDVFLLCGAVKNVAESDRCSTIILNEHRQSIWKRRSPPYHITIVNYHNDKKYHGVKKFISYEIQTEKIPQRVKRRYNQFDWLHKRLEEKYPNICIPPLPDKAVTGNFEDEFIMKRKAQLELWLNRLSSHPVISESEVFIHFLQCDDTDSKWKAGKRKAEKDEYRGAQWFCTLTVPGESVDTTASIKDRVEKFSKASIYLDNSVKNVSVALDKLSSFHSSSYKKELNNLGKRLEEFGSALSADSLDSANNSALSRAMVTSGNIYNQIGNLYGEQSKEDIGPLLDRLSLYRGIIQQMPDIVQFEKNAIQTYEEFQQKPEKLQGRSLMEVAPRREIISHITFAEINQFNKDKVDDLTIYMKTFLQKQIAFYTEITDCLKRAYSNFETIPVSTTTPTAMSSSSSSNFNKPAKK